MKPYHLCGNFLLSHKISACKLVRPFPITISDENNVVCGVINAYTAFAEIHIDEIWVDEASRHKGYGRQLLQALEKHFQGQGFNNINLVTSAFQAPEFYKKCGYSIEFTPFSTFN
jgi:ribosomal protein S18 acetylase RimI-like enzyme